MRIRCWNQLAASLLLDVELLIVPLIRTRVLHRCVLVSLHLYVYIIYKHMILLYNVMNTIDNTILYIYIILYVYLYVYNCIYIYIYVHIIIIITTCYSHQSHGTLRCTTGTASAHASVGSECSLQRCHSAQIFQFQLEKLGIWHHTMGIYIYTYIHIYIYIHTYSGYDIMGIWMVYITGISKEYTPNYDLDVSQTGWIKPQSWQFSPMMIQWSAPW